MTKPHWPRPTSARRAITPPDAWQTVQRQVSGATGGPSLVTKFQARFGLSDEQWENAVREVRQTIVRAAEDRRMTCYSELSAEVTSIHLGPYSSLMNHLLGEVFEREHNEGRPALTSLATHKYGD